MESQLTNEKLLEIISIQTEIVQQGTALDKIMEIVTDRALVLARGEGAAVELIDREELVYSSVAGIAEKFMGMRLAVKNSLSGECIDSREPLICNDAENDSRVNKQACRSIGLKSMIVLPLICDGKSIGVLKVFSKTVDSFGRAEVQVLELLTGLISAAMYHAMENDESELLFKATHDSLTGIPNRSLFYDRLRQKVSHLTQKDQHTFGVLSLDMDGFKLINDQFGHRTGDAALVETARRVKEILPEGDTFSRVGGDEFAILALSISDSADVKRMKERIYEEIDQPFYFEDHHVHLAVSIGYALYPRDGKKIEELIEYSDRSMYEEKRKRKAEAKQK
ncbi:GGDEF domain-containing protein [Sporosarcina sp. PTS2304]|uniref:sensor domain-containing diguanylate cyclase n=1 Tax=Sporosarcina sp. PTS2304 TaxID=2283194 RepID=UPI000E0DC980|nr:sensor domain-containing diguanylate cyclase [Sporosarcina sp. PTS2304]AXI00249.1 GGDEF domain-containing protein [Sporosarcina sp. PTS2304]